jgi:hypothetical protein
LLAKLRYATETSNILKTHIIGNLNGLKFIALKYSVGKVTDENGAFKEKAVLQRQAKHLPSPVEIGPSGNLPISADIDRRHLAHTANKKAVDV